MSTRRSFGGWVDRELPPLADVLRGHAKELDQGEFLRFLGRAVGDYRARQAASERAPKFEDVVTYCEQLSRAAGALRATLAPAAAPPMVRQHLVGIARQAGSSWPEMRRQIEAQAKSVERLAALTLAQLEKPPLKKRSEYLRDRLLHEVYEYCAARMVKRDVAIRAAREILHQCGVVDLPEVGKDGDTKALRRAAARGARPS